MTDLLDRMRAKLKHAQDHRMLAAQIDLEDLSMLVALASTRPITPRQWELVGTSVGPIER